MAFNGIPPNSTSHTPAVAAATGASPWSFPRMPFPLNGDGYVSFNGNIIPHNGTLVDNIDIPIAFSTSSTGDIIGKLGTATVWTVNATDVNAAADGFLGVHSFWYDNVNDRMYVFAVDTGTTPDTYYTKYITVETGAITDVGSVQVATDPASPTTASNLTISRAAVDSGNFTLTFNERTIVLSESDGSEVSNDASTNRTEAALIGSYASLDGTIHFNSIICGTTDNSSMLITRSGNSGRLPMPSVMFQNSSTTTLRAIAWGDKVKFIDSGGAAGKYLVRTFLRTEFDAWLSLVCDFGGVA